MRSTTCCLTLLSLAAALFPGCLVAQSAAPAAIGERVRIATPSQRADFRYVGRVVAVSHDSITIQSEDGLRPIAIGEITSVEVSGGRRTHGLQGMLYGSAIGVGAGAIIGAATYQKPKCDYATFFGCSDNGVGRGVNAFAGAITGGLLGLTIGGIYGVSHHTENWIVRSSGMPARVNVAPQRGGGAQLQLSMRF